MGEKGGKGGRGSRSSHRGDCRRAEKKEGGRGRNSGTRHLSPHSYGGGGGKGDAHLGSNSRFHIGRGGGDQTNPDLFLCAALGGEKKKISLTGFRIPLEEEEGGGKASRPKQMLARSTFDQGKKGKENLLHRVGEGRKNGVGRAASEPSRGGQREGGEKHMEAADCRLPTDERGRGKGRDFAPSNPNRLWAVVDGGKGGGGVAIRPAGPPPATKKRGGVLTDDGWIYIAASSTPKNRLGVEGEKKEVITRRLPLPRLR